MKRLALFFLCLTMGIGWAIAQNRTVTGTVISSEDNEPVIGANVVVEGQKQIGTTTDVEGHFKLSVPANAKRLTFSFAGLKSVTLDIQKVMNVTLNPEGLEEVVVIGYGSGQKLSTVSGSVARVSSEKIAERPVANVMDALQGQVAGMQVQTSSGDPNAVSSVTIHGNGSLGASSTPLYIVDGMQTDLGVVMSMNSNDFESVTVLKDASSTSIYGARAANGVVIITTKRGKSDEKGGKILLNAQYGVAQLINRAPYDQVMTADELIDYQVKHKIYGKNTREKWTGLLKDNFNMYREGANTDWLDYFMGKLAPTYQADLSFSGGSTRTQYYMSLGVFSQEGITRDKSSYNKYSGRLNLDSRIKDYMSFGVKISGSFGRSLASRFGGNAYIDAGTFGALLQPRYFTPYEEDGVTERSDVMEGWLGEWLTYKEQAKYYKRFGDTYQANLGSYLQLTPIEGLTLKTQAGIEVSHYTGSASMAPNYPISETGLGWVSRSVSMDNNFTWTNTAEYKFRPSDNHSLTFLLGQEFINYRGESFSASADGIEDPDFNLMSNGRLEKYLSLPGHSKSAYAYFSLFGRVNYGFNDLLFVDLSLRQDRSSRFGGNNQSAMFYSVGLMYDLYKGHLEHIKALDAMRLKASYGTTGNSAIGNYAHLALLGSTNYRNALGMGVTTPGNPDLSWERQANLNIGISAEMFDSRLRAELDYYFRNTDDMLISVPLPYSTGFASMMQNVGSMYNTGADLTLSYDFIRTKDLNVYGSATFNYNLQRITKLFYDLDEYSIPNTNTIWRVGHPNSFFVARFAGVNPQTGKQQWYDPTNNNAVTEEWNEDTLPQATEFAVNPPISGGFSLGASYKGLALDADFAYIVGKHMINNDRFFLEDNTDSFNVFNRSKKLKNEWEKPGQETEIPKYGEKMTFDDRLLENASFLRLKNLRLTYTLPTKWFAGNNVISGARVYVLGRNMLTFTKFTGFDPEVGGNMSMNQFPNTKMYVAGIQLSF